MDVRKEIGKKMQETEPKTNKNSNWKKIGKTNVPGSLEPHWHRREASAVIGK